MRIFHSDLFRISGLILLLSAGVMLSGVRPWGLYAQSDKGITAYLSNRDRGFYNDLRKDLSSDSRRYRTKVTVKSLAELPSSLNASDGKVLIVAYESEAAIVTKTLARSVGTKGTKETKGAKGADVVLWLVAKGKTPSLPKQISGFDAVTSPSAEDPAEHAYRNKLRAKLFR
ncbi:hypothetical protein P0082_09915 [Candidatus Haliotispira prima]|uniref:DUF4174 domain-containing protein n=1 Tax=Candidatus Haliotispira prima TaxID=3034016 RepID=A0ABY8MHI0_9SPIO|nr:hypothetical protein P0082_09915 [Candidatus Haliotispira prima]